MKLETILNRFGLMTVSQFDREISEIHAHVDSIEKQLKSNELGIDFFSDAFTELKDTVAEIETTANDAKYGVEQADKAIDNFDIDLYKDIIENWIEDEIKNGDVLTESNFDIDDYWRIGDYGLIDRDDTVDLIDEKLSEYEPEIDEPTVDTEAIVVTVAESLMGCLSRLTHDEPEQPAEPPAEEPEQPKEYVDHELMRILNEFNTK